MKLKLRIIALLIAGLPRLVAEQPSAWSVQLTGLGLERFDRLPVNLWMNRQGLVFLSTERLLVYQVSRAPVAKLGPRQASGGAGNFLLNIKVFDPQDGHLIKTLQLVTSAAISQVLATREGRFIVRTGDKLTMYSGGFEPLASREMKRERQTKWENWQVRVSPSGAQIVLLHEQVLSQAEILVDGSVLHDGSAKVDVEILDDGTLQVRKRFTLAHTLPFWSPSDGYLVSSNPAHSYNDQQVGILDYDGKWSPIHPAFKMPKSACGYEGSALDRQRIVVYGCETFTVLSPEGEQVFSKKDKRFEFASPGAHGPYLALQCESYRTGLALPSHIADLTGDIDRLQVYDVDEQKLVHSYRFKRPGVYYAISSRGDLAVADGATLSLIHSEQ